MVLVPRDISDEQLLSIVRGWVDVLAQEDYDAVFSGLGYLRSFEQPSAESIRKAIKDYRSPKYYPGVEDFVVTNWRTAQGGNPEPLKLIRRYQPNNLEIKATVEIDLPLNGRWSDLEADFVLFENKPHTDKYVLTLEDITSVAQCSEE